MAKNPKAAAKKPRKPRAAKDPKAPKGTAAAVAPAAPSAGSASVKHEFKKPPSTAVVALVRSLETKAQDVRDIAQAMGEQVSVAVETKHFDKKALGIARSLYRLAKKSPGAFSRTFAHLLAYCEDLELDKIADQNQGMDIDGTGDPAPVTAHGASAPAGEYKDETGDRDSADEQPAGGASPGLTIVPKAPATASEQVPSPTADEKAA